MTTQEQKALELALDALKSIKWVNSFNEGDYLTCNFKSVETSITAIKEALAQPEQEPVAEYIGNNPDEPDLSKRIGLIERFKFIPLRSKLYITPPQRKPLTHEQRFDLLTKFEPHKNKWEAPAILIDMVEAAHGIKE